MNLSMRSATNGEAGHRMQNERGGKRVNERGVEKDRGRKIMAKEKIRILQMFSDGKITTNEAHVLLAAHSRGAEPSSLVVHRSPKTMGRWRNLLKCNLWRRVLWRSNEWELI